MNHAVTIGDLLLSLCVFVGIPTTALGALMIFAGGMSDVPEESISAQGCLVGLIGAVLLIGGVWGLLV